MQVRPFSPKREKYVGNDFQLFPASLSCVDERRFPLVLNGVGRGGEWGAFRNPFCGFLHVRHGAACKLGENCAERCASYVPVSSRVFLKNYIPEWDGED